MLSKKYRNVDIVLMLLTTSAGFFSKKANAEFFFKIINETDKSIVTKERHVFSGMVALLYFILFFLSVFIFNKFKLYCDFI
ncbi:hypothetical protein [Candidatus Raskinella chloraquaticus]|uniref:hypothetical protein n=1 Tax=Candidatus Raskinella chloraquaticus TaxID=1951219 RepID=UPI00378644E8